ncbi:ABC transporter ATP-binding protein [Mycoplasmopsis pulmonis]|uniref:ABC transporter ATP-binding protein n=1 Tax=Mycoplasmopsis pulmonis TaxID=2107 RepID=UPI00100521C9|nr:ABC transporter ATP-binding protein [Mycoplasmopsis pulmonis]MDZ7293580.1 ABC transporter ATP-binding protein [Mycoplasmopsis pulmonis]VEU68383.1 sugar ABC transporter ATP-binding protein MGLA [Mycoplasmopsis pulmonis]
MENAIEFINITKDFGTLRANDNVSFSIKKGSIHALIGENGAGKSTLMSMLFGMYEPSSGEIKVNGNAIFIKNPNQANNLGIGMVHQHFKNVDIYSNLENVVLGNESDKKLMMNFNFSKNKIELLQDLYNLKFNLKEKTGDATVSTQQKVEIMKMLYRDVEILIFDEPTAVLTPQEIDGFLKTLLLFKEKGKTIIFISHKLNEIKAVADQATVLRHGKVVAHYDDIKDVSIEKISEDMVGKKVVMPKNEIDNNFLANPVVVEFDKVSLKAQRQIQDVSFDIRLGEIFVIAGVGGNGQDEIEFAISGLLKPKSGKIFFYPKDKQSQKRAKVDITKYSVAKKRDLGISYVPGDRHKYGLVLDYSIEENSIIRRLKDKSISKLGFIKKDEVKKFNSIIQKNFDVRGSNDGKSDARSLSGGNQQKAIVGREILTQHDLLIMVQPTRGLDIGAINKIHNFILEEKKNNKAILLISYELDEILALADTIAVINKGRLSKKMKTKEITRTQIGLLMAGKQLSGETHE